MMSALDGVPSHAGNARAKCSETGTQAGGSLVSQGSSPHPLAALPDPWLLALGVSGVPCVSDTQSTALVYRSSFIPYFQ